MKRGLIAVLSFLLTGTVALADNWSLDMSRGTVEIQRNGTWIGVQRGAVIPDGTLIRTGLFGQARLSRGKEWVDLNSMTMIVIHDRDGQSYTTVLQMAGSVEVEAEARNVEHFSVETPYLAAVVKGTHFTVAVRRGASSVSVDRGRVSVSDHTGEQTFVVAGQTVDVVKGGGMTTTGEAQPTTGDGVTARETVAEVKGPEQGQANPPQSPGEAGRANANEMATNGNAFGLAKAESSHSSSGSDSERSHSSDSEKSSSSSEKKKKKEGD